MNTIDEAIEILKAMKEGKEIEIIGSNHYTNAILPNFSSHTYRIKPEPKEVWVNEYRYDDNCAYSTKESAMRAASSNATRVAVRYREVIE